MTLATHYQAKKACNQILPLIKLTVYRDSSAKNHAIEREDILKITLLKDPGKPLGIKLVGKRYDLVDNIPQLMARLQQGVMNCYVFAGIHQVFISRSLFLVVSLLLMDS